MKGNCIGRELRQGHHRQEGRTQRDSSVLAGKQTSMPEASLEISAPTAPR